MALEVIVEGIIILIISGTTAGISNARSIRLSYQLESVREQISIHLRAMEEGLNNITTNIAYFENHWTEQYELISDIIKKLEPCARDGRKLIKPLARAMASKAKKIIEKSKTYSKDMQLIVNANVSIICNKFILQLDG